MKTITDPLGKDIGREEKLQLWRDANADKCEEGRFLARALEPLVSHNNHLSNKILSEVLEGHRTRFKECSISFLCSEQGYLSHLLSRCDPIRDAALFPEWLHIATQNIDQKKLSFLNLERVPDARTKDKVVEMFMTSGTIITPNMLYALSFFFYMGVDDAKKFLKKKLFSEETIRMVFGISNEKGTIVEAIQSEEHTKRFRNRAKLFRMFLDELKDVLRRWKILYRHCEWYEQFNRDYKRHILTGSH